MKEILVALGEMAELQKTKNKETYCFVNMEDTPLPLMAIPAQGGHRGVVESDMESEDEMLRVQTEEKRRE